MEKESILDEEIEEIETVVKKHKTINVQNKEYESSKRWQCKKSPNKSHYWEFGQPKYKKDLIINNGKCKYCLKEKTIIIKDRN